MGSDDAGTTTVTIRAHVSITTTTPPETMLAAMAGRHAAAVVDHYALDLDGLVIERAALEGCPAHNGAPAEWKGFCIVVPQLIAALP